MIFKCIQKSRLPISRHEFILGSDILANAEVPKAGTARMIYGTDCFDIQMHGIFNKLSLLKNGTEYGCVGSKVFETKKVLFIKMGYEYFELMVNNEMYLVYETGLGANKHFYSIYKNDVLLAVIHKPDRVKNNLDEYVCYLDNADDFISVALFCLFLESTAYYNIDAIGNTDECVQTVTVQKELIEKFDPSFIERIKAKDSK